MRCSDWAELQILYAGATSVSLESIRTEIDVEGMLDNSAQFNTSDTPNEESEQLVANVVREIDRRAVHGGKGYPFRIRENRLELRPGAHRWTPYAFCLMVSDRDYWSSGDPSPKMFEHIASKALQIYLHGSAILFGAPRDAPDQNIRVALTNLAKRTGDRFISIYPIKPTDKDLGLDVVGWKDFADGETSKVLVYMQCATGEHWETKKSDLDLGTSGVWNHIMAWTTPPVKALAVPYVVPPGDDWQRVTPGLLLLDRLRISSLLPAKSVSIKGFDWLGWFKSRVHNASTFQGL